MDNLERQELDAEARLRSAATQLRRAEIKLNIAKARRDEVIRDSRDLLSRRRAAAVAGLTPGRVQQIVDGDPLDIEELLRQDRQPIGLLLRERRIELGLTQEELSNRLGLHPTQLGRVESGKAKPRVDHLQEWVEKMGGKLEVRFDW